MSSIDVIINEILDSAKDKTNFNELLDLLIKRIYMINKDNVMKDTESLQLKITENYKLIKCLNSDLSLDEYKKYVMTKLNENDLNTILLYVKSPIYLNLYN